MLWLDCLVHLAFRNFKTYDEQLPSNLEKSLTFCRHLKFCVWLVLKNFPGVNFCGWHVLKNFADIYTFTGED